MCLESPYCYAARTVACAASDRSLLHFVHSNGARRALTKHDKLTDKHRPARCVRLKMLRRKFPSMKIRQTVWSLILRYRQTDRPTHGRGPYIRLSLLLSRKEGPQIYPSPPPVALLPDSGSWPSPTGFPITFIRHTIHSVGLLWTSDQSEAETCI